MSKRYWHLWEEEGLLRISRYKGHRRPLGIHHSHSMQGETDACTQLLQTPFRIRDMVSSEHQTTDLLSPSKFLASTPFWKRIIICLKYSKVLSFKLGFNFDNPSLIFSLEDLDLLNILVKGLTFIYFAKSNKYLAPLL